mmetsp:Transcript_106144/g.199849  ORF Transcript_106144/g.199849 Transcript_106144/m.199849 type:complete len:308 (-) Transcript_106144:213-1136(-)
MMDTSPLVPAKLPGGGNYYYGRNDKMPMSLGKQICMCMSAIIFSPILLIFIVLFLVFMCVVTFCQKVNVHQMASARMLVLELWYKSPGKLLLTKESNHSVTDIFIPTACVNEHGQMDVCRSMSFKKSLEFTVRVHSQSGPHGPKIDNDDDPDRPNMFFHAWPDPIDPQGDELWCSHARRTLYAGVYSWSIWIPGAWLFPGSHAIDVHTIPDVMGYIYLLEITNPEFYKHGSRVHVMAKPTPNVPPHTAETDGKIFVRYNYWVAQIWGDIPRNDPDAYVFKGRVLQEANLKIIHTYRVLKPVMNQMAT